MDKIPFQDGTKIKNATVTINEQEYEVTPAQYSGTTPMSAFNLNKMQDNIENEFITVNENKNEMQNQINNIENDIVNINYAKDELQKQVNSLASGSPAGIYNTLADLQEDNPDHSKIYLVVQDGNWYYYNGSSWIAGGVYQSTGISTAGVKQENLANNLSQYCYLDMQNDFNWESGNINSNGSLSVNNNRARTINSKYLKKGTIINVNPGYSLGIHQYINNQHKLLTDGTSTLFVIDTDADYKFTVSESPYGTYETTFFESEAFNTALNNISIELADKINTQNLATKKLGKGYDYITLASYNHSSKILTYSNNRIIVYLDASYLNNFYIFYDNKNYYISVLASNNINSNDFSAYYPLSGNWTNDNNIKVAGGNQYLIAFRKSDNSVLELSEDFLLNNIGYKLIKEDIFNLQSQIDNLSNNNSLINQSFSDEIDLVKTELSNNQNGNTLSFAFITDLHLDTTDSEQLEMYKNICYSLQELIDSSNIAFVAFGGDNTYNLYPADLQKQKDLTNTFRSLIYKYTKKPLLIANGNHDDNSIRNPGVSQENQVYTPTVTIFGHQLYNYYAKFNENTNVVFGELGNNYCYIDFPTHKIRVFLLNSVDVPYTLNDNGQLEYTAQWTFAYRNTQLNFVANSLKFEDKKDDAENWKAIFIEHANLPNTPTFSDIDIINNDILVAIINAYQNGTSYTVSNKDETWGYNIDVTYNHKGEVIASFGGHMHTNLYQNFNNIACINSETARYTDREGYNNLVDKTAFDIYTIDLVNKTIKATRFGYGENREFNF